MKGQSAIEYLMSYGWMLLVVAIIGGAIYSFTGSQCAEQASGFNGERIQIEDFGLTEDNKMALELRNADSEPIKVNSIDISGNNNTTSVTIPVAESANTRTSGFRSTTSCNTHDVEINYDSGNLENISVNGQITGQYEAVQINQPGLIDVTQ